MMVLVLDFYDVCWPLIGSFVINSFNDAFRNGKLSVLQQRGILSRLHKKNERELLKNWRPISLLCVDCKIITHI